MKTHVAKITIRDFRLGGVELYGPAGIPRVSIAMKHGEYIVRGLTSAGGYFSLRFKTLTNARKYARDVVAR